MPPPGVRSAAGGVVGRQRRRLAQAGRRRVGEGAVRGGGAAEHADRQHPAGDGGLVAVGGQRGWRSGRPRRRCRHWRPAGSSRRTCTRPSGVQIVPLPAALTLGTAPPLQAGWTWAWRAIAEPLTMAMAELTEPRTALSLAMRASRCRLVKRGRATAARMPRMMMTTINSIIVKPDC